MTDQFKLKWVMFFSVLFIALNTFFIAKEIYWFMLLPVVLLTVLTAFVALDMLLLAIVFLTPLSVIFQQYDFGVAIALPTEPLLFGVMLIYLLRLFYEGKIERKIFFHPVTIAIFINLGWIFFTSITSTLPMVSWKFLLARLWLVIPFYFVALHMFRGKAGSKRDMGDNGNFSAVPNIFKTYIWLYVIAFSGVIVYALVNHAMDNFSEEAAHVAMTPFYNDHTSYGAMLAMFIPLLVLFAFGSGISRQVKYVALFMLLLFITGLIFSYTRAAWISVIGAVGVLLIYLLRIRLAPILMMTGVAVILFFIYQTDIMIALQSGRYKNTENRNIEQRVRSIANITTDASNTERLNRWASAMRMFREKPFFGWGPGTYQFQYAPFQLSSEMTVISTRSGERGNAHSEYIGPLAEMGVFGLLTVLGIVVTTLLTAGRIIYFTANKRVKWFAVAVALGLVTYFIHGLLNNFLDTDKASAPFWGFIAMLVALDIREKETKAEEQDA